MEWLSTQSERIQEKGHLPKAFLGRGGAGAHLGKSAAPDTGHDTGDKGGGGVGAGGEKPREGGDSGGVRG